MNKTLLERAVQRSFGWNGRHIIYICGGGNGNGVFGPSPPLVLLFQRRGQPAACFSKIKNFTIPGMPDKLVNRTLPPLSSPPPPPSSVAAVAAPPARPANEIPPIQDVKLTAASHQALKDNFHKTFADAVRPFYKEQKPVVLRAFLAHHDKWARAMERWRNREYMSQRVGPERIVQAEIGYYSSEEICDIPFGYYLEYLETFETLYGKNTSTGAERPVMEQVLYMAQNDIPPKLLSDIEIPRLCSDASFEVGHGSPYSVMFWMGPHSSLSPLHTDPLDNLLFQVVGRKQLILIDPSNLTNAVDQLYVGPKYKQQANTSAVGDPEQYVHELHPNFPDLSKVALKTVLQPGDVLFIPSRWWHSAKALDFSTSVNSWFR